MLIYSTERRFLSSRVDSVFRLSVFLSLWLTVGLTFAELCQGGGADKGSRAFDTKTTQQDPGRREH